MPRERRGGEGERGGGDDGEYRKRRTLRKIDYSKELVDPKLVEQYRSVRQGDRKRELFAQMKEQNADAKKARRTNAKRLRKALGSEAPLKAVPKTKERLRKPDVSFVEKDHEEEIGLDEKDDEFAKFYAERQNPKIIITTCPKPSYRTKRFVKELKWIFPNSVSRPRKDYTITEITQFAMNRGYTDVVVVGERIKEPFELIVSHLPEGPTATFRISNFLTADQLEEPAERTEHYPELIFKNFDTRLGRRIKRMFEALFPATRDYDGRAVATMHNQRDFIFFRTHRYIFDSTKAVRIQEMGPRFTLRLMSLQSGLFDVKFGEYEWFRKKEHDSDKLEWYL